jgi:predicted metal-binding membrane protein
LGLLTTFAGAGYFFVWIALGLAAFPLGVALATLEMQHESVARAVPMAVGAVILIAGMLQFTGWKARQLACCREAPAPSRAFHGRVGTAWRHGLQLGFRCVYCCAPLTAILLVTGVMDLRMMALVTVAVTVERLAPAGQRVARVIGSVVIAAGLFLIARAGAWI